MERQTARSLRVFQRLLVLAATLTWGLAGLGVGALAQGTDVRYFPATGHTVQGEFLAFFERYGGEEVFGLPRT
jgi:hypothetical protein